MNFYFVNGGIILPVFGEDARSTDREAADILKALYPKRRIISLPSIGIIKEGGNVHCITQQMPLVRSRA
jgi:agmatine deiminase